MCQKQGSHTAALKLRHFAPAKMNEAQTLSCSYEETLECPQGRCVPPPPHSPASAVGPESSTEQEAHPSGEAHCFVESLNLVGLLYPISLSAGMHLFLSRDLTSNSAGEEQGGDQWHIGGMRRCRSPIYGWNHVSTPCGVHALAIEFNTDRSHLYRNKALLVPSHPRHCTQSFKSPGHNPSYFDH